jgi:Domain of unknown function (DUF4328)
MAVNYRAERYLSPQMLCTVVTVLLGVYIVESVAALGSSLLKLELLNRMASGGQWTEAQTYQNDARERLIGVIGLVIFWITGIPFLMLMGRFNHNAWSFGAQDMKYTPGWTVAWFFIPFFNLVRPLQAMQEVGKISRPGSGDWRQRPASGLIGAWWALWILAHVLGHLSTQTVAADEVPALQTHTSGVIIVDIFCIAMGVAALMMVRQLNAWQEARHTSGLRYNEDLVMCPGCGEPADLTYVKCQMCGADYPVAVATG